MTTIRAQVVLDGDASGLRSALSESEKDLASLNATGQKVEILRGAVDSAKAARAAMLDARDAARTLDEQLAAARGAGAGRDALRLLEQALKDANREARDTEKAWDASRDKLDKARAAAAAAGVDTRNLATEEQRLKTEIDAATAAVQRNAQAIQDARAAKEAKLAADRAAAAEEQRLAAIVEANLQRQKMAAQELLEAERRAAQEAQLAANKVAAGQREAAAAAEALNAAFRQLGVRPLQEVVAETNKLQAALAKVRESGISGPEQQQAIAAFQAKLAALKAEANGVGPATDNAAAGVRDLGREAESMGGMVGGAARQLVAMAGAIVGLQGASNLAKDVINTGAAFESLEGRLTSLLGSTDKARDAFGQIKDLARTTPFEVAGLTEAYVKLTAFGLQPSMTQMQAIADTAATLGGGTEALSRVTLALGQAWTKSKLQGDEILQLAEAGVPVWDLLAKATGKNVAELQKMSEAGTLGRSVILQLIDALGKENLGASAKLMETYSGAVANAKDALAEFYDMIAKSGVLEYLTDQLRDLLAEFDRMKDNGELKTLAKDIADGFVKTAEGIKTAVEAVSAMSGVIKIAIEGYVAWRVAGMTLIPMLSGVGTAAGAAAVETRAMGAAAATAAVETRALGAAAGTSAGGVGLLGNALRLLKGAALVGLVTEVAGLGMEFFRAKAAAEDADRVIRDMLKPTPINGPAKELELVETKAAQARVKTEELAQAFYVAQEAGKGAAESIKAALDGAKLDDPFGVADMIRGLNQIQGSARATGEEIRAGLVERLKNLPARELQEFGALADFAFKRGKLSAEELEFTLGVRLDAAMAKLGVSASTAADGMTGAFRETAKGVSLLTADLQSLKDRGVDTDRVFIDLITKTLPQAASRREFEFLKDQVERFGAAAGLAKDDVDRLLTMIQQKADGARPGIQSLSEAFSQLGLKSRESLQQAESAAKEAFDYIRNNGGTIQEQARAWEKYAAAAKEAHNGIIPPMVAAQGELYKIATAGSAAGKGIHDGMTTAGSAVQKVLSDAERLASRLQSLKNMPLGGTHGNQSGGNGSYDDLRKAGITGADMQRMGYSSREIEDYLTQNDKAPPGFVNRQVTSNAVNTYQMAVDNGLNDAEAKKFVELYPYYAAKANADARGMRSLGSAESLRNEYIAIVNNNAKQAMDEARRLVAEENQKKGGAPNTWGPAPKAVTVNLNINGRTTPVQVTDQAQADALARALQEALAAKS